VGNSGESVLKPLDAGFCDKKVMWNSPFEKAGISLEFHIIPHWGIPTGNGGFPVFSPIIPALNPYSNLVK
jgi:hypothetical protein